MKGRIEPPVSTAAAPFWDASRERRLVLQWCIECERAIHAMSESLPYCVALVTLEGGARLMTNVVGCDPESVHVGMRVQVDWEPISDGRALPVFRPAERTPPGTGPRTS